MPNACNRYSFGDFTLDVHERRVSSYGETVRLAPKAFDLLLALVRRADNERENQPGSPTAPDLTREAIAKRAAAREQLLRRASQDASGAASRATACGPPRVMPAVMRYAFGIELLFTPGRVTMLLELGPTVRRIYTDGRMHSSDPDPTRAGESIGHWEGDTLVVDTTGIIAMTQMMNGVYTSGQTHITERIRRIDRTHRRSTRSSTIRSCCGHRGAIGESTSAPRRLLRAQLREQPRWRRCRAGPHPPK
jgi:hypothetical protein